VSNNKSKFDLPKVAFFAAIALMLFFAGGEFAQRNWHPWKFYTNTYKDAKQLILQSLATRPYIMEEIKYKGDGVVRYDANKAFDGYTLVQGWFSEGTDMRLLDMKGNIVHQWPVSFSKLWPDPKHLPDGRIPETRFNLDIQGMWLYPDGAIVFNFAELGTVKLDKCGKVIWKLNRRTHHSVTVNPDGSMWIPALAHPDNIDDKLIMFGQSRQALMRRENYEDRILLVDAHGKVKKEFSLLKILIDAGLEDQLYDVGNIVKNDPTHLNDIDVVTAALANKLTGVNEGDLLVSVRQMHMLAILDKDDGHLKWHKSGPWVRQHDPDITAAGNIEVFNNRRDYFLLSKASGHLPGSNIVSFDPVANKVSIIYPQAGQETFYTEIQGVHQLLPNGNRLILESKAGRIFEIDDKGKIVWEYIKPYDDKYADWFSHAIRFEKNYFSVKDWTCH